MPSLRRMIVAASLASMIAGCVEAGPGRVANQDENRFITVTGALSYRERIALSPGASAKITLSDVSIADKASAVLIEEVIALEGRQVPVPFALEVEKERLKPGMRYAVRGTIIGPGGQLLWTTDTLHLVDQEKPSNSLGVLLMVRVDASAGGKRTTVQTAEFQCGETRVQTRFQDDRLMLRIDGRKYDLGRAVSASGARYVSDEGVERAEFWEKGGSAMLEVAGEIYPECRKVETTDNGGEPLFKATGNEPGWSLRIAGGKIELTRNYGAERVEMPTPGEQPLDRGYRYETITDAHRLRVDIVQTVCRDSMTGMPHPATVSLAIDGERLTGCGGAPETLLQGSEWVVEDIGGKGIIDFSRATLNFDENGRLSGRATCNSYTADYELTGENLVIGKIATSLMACPPALGNQEAELLRILAAARGFDVTPTGALLIRAGSGETIEARR